LLVAILVSSHGIIFAQGERPLSFSIGLVESFDDNRDGVSSGKESLLETRVYPRADFKLYRDQIDLDIFYSPSLCYRDNPRPDQNTTDIYHDFGLDSAFRASERMRFNFALPVSMSDTPAEMVSSQTFHEFVTYTVFRPSLAASYEVIPSRALVAFRGDYMLKRYKGETYAAIGDEDEAGVGASAKYVMKSGWNLLGDISYGNTDLGNSNSEYTRSTKVFYGGLGLEKVFGLWSARARIGLDSSSSEIAGSSVIIKESVVKPGGDIDVSYVPTDMTRISASLGYHTLRSDIVPFAKQQRTSLALSASHKFTERLELTMRGVYGSGEYSDIAGFKSGGTDSVSGLGGSLAYSLNRNLSIAAGYRFEDWKSDVRDSYRRNVGDVSVRAQF